MNTKEYIVLYHFDSNITTIDKLISTKNSKLRNWDVGSLCCFKDENGITNIERIYKLYKVEDHGDPIDEFKLNIEKDIKLAANTPEKSWSTFNPKYNIIKMGTELLVPVSVLQPDMKLSRNKDSIRGKYDDVLTNAKIDLQLARYGELFENNNYSERRVKFTVYLWCRSISDIVVAGNTEGHLDGVLMDISPYVHSMSIHKSMGGGSIGSFSLELAAIQAYKDENNKFVTSDDLSYYTAASVHKMWNSMGYDKRGQTYFNNIISRQDIVFLKFDTANPYPDNIVDDSKGIIVDKSVLESDVFDMIGLVESSDVDTVGDSNDIRIMVNGSDLMTLLNEDGSSIYAQRFVSSGKFHDQESFEGGIVRYQGKYVSSFQLEDQLVRDQILFTIDYLSRTRICNDSLFDGISGTRVNKINLPESSVIGQKVHGIWKIVDVVVDNIVANKRSFNKRIGNSYDPLTSSINRICRLPMVEFFGDTYGNKFFLVARRPIYDYKSIMAAYSSGLIHRINEANIISDNLKYDSRAYTWYKLDYKYITDFFGYETAWLVPAIYFEEYGSIWGDRPMVAEDPYLDYQFKVQQDRDEIFGKKIIRQNLQDLKYMIESNAYLPFTRSGRIVVNGDRRIKIGMWIINEGTGEIFYVKGVSHYGAKTLNSSTRSTSLQVERGMVFDDLDTYFNIINMDIKEGNIDDYSRYINETLMSWIVNTSNFNKLLKRRTNSEGGHINV